MRYFLAFAGLFSVAVASAQHSGDIYVHNLNGRLATGTVDEDGNVESLDTRVFGAELGEFEPFYTDEPGFDSAVGAFSSSSNIGFNFVGQLTKWTGNDFVATNERVRGLYQVGATTLSATTGNGLVNGFSLPVESDGVWHRHIGWQLLGNGGTDPAEGVYGLRLQLKSDQIGLSNSKEFWFVLNNGADETDHDAAIDFANTVVPEPGSMLALGAAAMLLVRRKK